MAEGFGIIALCQTHHMRRKYGVMILREVKNIAMASKCLQVNKFLPRNVFIVFLFSQIKCV